MPEYVYALHDFLPEHEDEVSFHAGERIEVIEKDDLYGDGWWQGRNLAGKAGLFPQSYTAPAPPSSEVLTAAASSSTSTSEASAADSSMKPTLQPLDEEPESESPTNPTTQNIIAPIPQAPAIFLNGNDTTDSEYEGDRQGAISTGDGEVMKATMTDVQKAIEQLGMGRSTNGDGDEARSFSFASSRGDQTEGDTDTDFELSDMDGADGGTGENWHKGARTKLAEKARRAVEEAEKLEAMMGGLGMLSSDRRFAEPPIEVELSDESEGEDGDYTTHSNIFPREHPHIPEEDEDIETDPEQSKLAQHKRNLSGSNSTPQRASSRASSTHVVVPDRDESEAQTVTATRTSFPFFPSPPTVPTTDMPPVQSSLDLPEPNSVRSSYATSRSSYATQVSPVVPSQPEPPSISLTDAESKRTSAPYRESLIALPSPTGSFPGISNGVSHPTEQSKHSSVASASSHKQTGSTLSQPPLTASSVQNTLVEEREKKDKAHPSEWSVEEVVEWLKSKGFDQDVCDKFTEQEITGDVLLELDVNLLKIEIGIMAFGKRMRIANAITDLRRPPSIIYSDQPEQVSPSLVHTPLSPSQSQSHSQHSRHQSQSHSHHSFPGTGYAYSQTQSYIGSSAVYSNGTTYAGTSVPQSPIQEYIPGSERSTTETEHGVGLGIRLPPGAAAPAVIGEPKSRPAQLMLSPSDGALNETAKTVIDVPEPGEDDRGHMSESEAVQTTSMRRRLFGRSHDSSTFKADSSANSGHSKETIHSITLSQTTRDISEKDKGKDKDKEKDSSARNARAKRSLDGGKGGGERLSIFGGSFSGTLGKSRKPPPKYQSLGDDLTSDKGSMFSIPRLHSSGSRKGSSTSQRPITPNASTKNSPKQAAKEHKEKVIKESPTPVAPVAVVKETRDHALLRKRTSSAPAPPTLSSEVTKNGSSPVSPLKLGHSILEQIGEHDHSGWMRKKGDRYNNWKLRYFVLKGAHLYCLRSDSNAETKIKGYINIVGYKVTVDENVNPGRYGFRIDHDNDKTHYFSSDDKTTVRDWMKAIMKATIGRDYTKPVISSCNIPTIPLTVAQAMNPAPRPPSPTARDATQKALRRENPHQLSSRDARVLMGLPSSHDSKEDRSRLESFFAGNEAASADSGAPSSPVSTAPPKSPAAPTRPSREMRGTSANRSSQSTSAEDKSLIEWANSHLPSSLRVTDPTGPLCGGLALLRLAESIKGRPSSPPVPDSAFPVDTSDDKLDGLFGLFDFLLDNDVKMGSVSINDVRQGKRDKILQLLRALKAWEDKRRAIAQSIGGASSVQAGGFMAPVGMVWS
ncbi:hypothetical protein Hypma_013044 [Hypsizygus marmoreus]|uniref:Protein pob1 n=1 Tax=Hypsizygus marmoreus TaxID=39966 RepID=A0A369JKU8_HYPMA|nr:hypothetical protein Hypma_013044 [Hypsizygus marmoreus]